MVTLDADTDPRPAATSPTRSSRRPATAPSARWPPTAPSPTRPDENYNGYDSVGFRVDDGTLRSRPGLRGHRGHPGQRPARRRRHVDRRRRSTRRPVRVDLAGERRRRRRPHLRDRHAARARHPRRRRTDGTVTYTARRRLHRAGLVHLPGADGVDDPPTTCSGPRPSARHRPPSPSAPPSPARPSTCRPSAATATPGSAGRLRLTDGGSPITGYEVAVSSGRRHHVDVGIDPRSQIVGEPRQRHRVHVRGPGPERQRLRPVLGGVERDPAPTVVRDRRLHRRRRATHPFCPEITWMADNDIAEGYPDGTYRPVGPRSPARPCRPSSTGSPGAELGPDPTCTAKPVPRRRPIDQPLLRRDRLDGRRGHRRRATPTAPSGRPSRSPARRWRRTSTGSAGRPGAPTRPAPATSSPTSRWRTRSAARSTGWSTRASPAGFDDGTFGPQPAISRQAMAAFLFRYNILEGFIVE